MGDYFARIPKLVEEHRAKCLVRGGDPETMEGSEPPPDAAFIIAFPDPAHAKSFWNTDVFQALVVLRQPGFRLNAILADKIS